jgi:hypothetical protein
MGAMEPVKDQLSELEILDFTGKGEAFVEARFLTPLLASLGYETHKDYEVVRHGDEGSAFKLHYPPVEKGAQRVKHYNPDYVPTIRKKMFWIIEAKSPKDVAYPFEAKYLVQGLQYCIHPEIQAKWQSTWWSPMGFIPPCMMLTVRSSSRRRSTTRFSSSSRLS